MEGLADQQEHVSLSYRFADGMEAQVSRLPDGSSTALVSDGKWSVVSHAETLGKAFGVAAGLAEQRRASNRGDQG